MSAQGRFGHRYPSAGRDWLRPIGRKPIKEIVMTRGVEVGIVVGLGASVMGAAGAIWYVDTNLHTFERQTAKVHAAGYRSKVAAIAGSQISYLEGPDNGPALLLIHAHGCDKANYAPALPALATSFHVYAVDCYGHGRSSHDPAKYTVAAQGQDLLALIADVITVPVLLSGHSLGGITAAWLAGHGDRWIRGVLFEDPPFFMLDLPQARTHYNWVEFASTAHGFLVEGGSDWTLYFVEHSRMWTYIPGSARFIAQARRCRSAHPGEPIRWAWLPPILNEYFRAIPQYDPRFGDVFYRGEWETGFDLETALKSTTIPSTYQRSEAVVDADGVLRGATSPAEAARATALLTDVRRFTDNDGHTWHWRHPQQFVQRLQELEQRASK
jgi:pimeloyl-ACP methyl ester carboxylesterase